MKKIILLFAGLAFLTFKNQAQTDSIIIDPSSASIFVVDIDDTLITSYTSMGCTTTVYTLDMDGNNITDFTFTANCYMGGMGSWAMIKLSSSDSCMFSVDNSVIDTVGQIDSLGQIIYSPDVFTMVRIYNMFDTLFLINCLNQNNVDISAYSTGSFPSFYVHNSLDNWISGDHYIGIRKKINNINYPGWIKVEVLNYYKIIIKEYALNKNLLNVNQLEITPISIFPNPVTDRVFINYPYTEENVKMQVYNMLGDCVFQSVLTSGTSKIDISSLTTGVYIIHLAGVDWTIQRKLIKE